MRPTDEGSRARHRPRAALLAIVTGVAIMTAACSGSPLVVGGASGSPRAAASSSQGSDRSSSARSSATLQQRVLAYAKCMRSHGIPVPNLPAPGHLPPASKPTAQPAADNGPNPDSPQFDAAQQACQSLLPTPVKGGPGPGGPAGG
jgi:hypothetical protein